MTKKITTEEKKIVTYSKEFLQLLDSVKGVNKTFRVEKEKDEEGENNGRITIKHKGEAINMLVSVPESNLAFDGEQIAFYDYPEFHKILSTFAYPEAEQLVDADNKEMFRLKQGKSRIDYYLADPENFDQKTFRKPKAWEADIEFQLSKLQIKKLSSVSSLFASQYITFDFKSGSKELDLELSGSSKNDNKYQESYEILSQSEECPENVSITIMNDVISSMPEGDWNVKINTAGLVKFTYINEADITLELYTGSVEKD